MKDLPTSFKIVLIGAGNVATQLGLSLSKKGVTITQVYNRTLAGAQQLANKLNTRATNSINDIDASADLYLLAVKDDALAEVLTQIKFIPKLIAHTSGTLPLAIFKGKFKNNAVIYPLQTISKSKRISFSKVPFFLEANNKQSFEIIEKVAGLLSSNLHKASTEKRKALHVAAVFACNFSNHMYAIASEILQKEKIPFDVLLPLIHETAEKAKAAEPAAMQTGPASRNDKRVIEEHLKYLKESPSNKKIYTLVSQSISDFTKKYGAKSKS